MSVTTSLGMDVPTAITTAKHCRSIIDPIGQLPEFLKRLYMAYSRSGGSPFVLKLQQQQLIANEANISIPAVTGGSGSNDGSSNANHSHHVSEGKEEKNNDHSNSNHNEDKLSKK